MCVQAAQAFPGRLFTEVFRRERGPYSAKGREEKEDKRECWWGKV